MRAKLAFVLVPFLAACGGSSEPAQQPTQRQASAGEERPREREDGSQITGLLGTIRADQVQMALDPRVPRFMRCFEQRMGEVEFLGGEVRLSFRIHTDGSVAWVFPVSTTVGDRAAESCVVEAARAVRFPQPHGGEAEFQWGFGFDPPDDVRQPLNWDQAHVQSVLTAAVPDLVSRCGRGGFRVTAYVSPGGQVLSAGASAPDADSLAAIDCVVEGVRALTMPDPGSYPAKVTFDVR